MIELHDKAKSLSHMQCQMELMELLVKNQQQAGVITDTTGPQNILQVPFGQVPIATNEFQVPSTERFFVTNAPFCAPFFSSQPLAVLSAVQPVNQLGGTRCCAMS